MKWLWKLTGGRPMIFIRFQFTDIVVGMPVNSYMDRLGRYWLANHSWSLFRVRMSGSQIIDALTKAKRDDPTTADGFIDVTVIDMTIIGGGGVAGGPGYTTIPIDRAQHAVLPIMDDY
jgi:hypothetical protein